MTGWHRALMIASLAASAGCAPGAPRGVDPWTKVPAEYKVPHAKLDPATTRPASLNVIAIDQEGYPIDPDDPGKFDHRLAPSKFREKLDAMMKAADAWTASHPKDHAQQVLIFVHGGLNEPLENLNLDGRLVEHRRLLMGEGFYPIFVVWHSGLLSSYGEHLTKVRQGRYEANEGWAAPFFFLADFGRAVARAPIIGARMLTHDFSRLAGEWKAAGDEDQAAVLFGNPQLRSATYATEALVHDYAAAPDDAIQVSFTNPERKPTSRGRVVLLGVEALCRGVLTPTVDMVGMAAWDNMYRRSQMLFDGPNANLLGRASQSEARKLAEPGDPGPLQQLIDALAVHAAHVAAPSPTTAVASTTPVASTAAIAPTPAPRPTSRWKVTIVGHSMGAIVLDEFVRRSAPIDIDNIVYMAAACSVRDAYASVMPYLATHEHAHFFNLTLHPVNDLREDNTGLVGPRGSLLVWIDDIFANPATALDRTMGRWDNAVQTAFAIPGTVRKQVTFKAFPLLVQRPRKPDGTIDPDPPQVHGDFAGCNYGDPLFWNVPLPAGDADATPAVKAAAKAAAALNALAPVSAQMRRMEAKP